ncbi:hypothetical protein PLICRDRAFT_548880 [Plicaturopsis crispa FD-325 SS-3]|nr:hypothetical protein PLICRDRAFT_548880 [Plicaturopsis crispa FD-325 SS-3]
MPAPSGKSGRSFLYVGPIVGGRGLMVSAASAAPTVPPRRKDKVLRSKYQWRNGMKRPLSFLERLNNLKLKLEVP